MTTLRIKLSLMKNICVLGILICLVVSVSRCNLHSVKIEIEGGNAVQNTEPAVITCSYNKTTDEPVLIVTFFHTDNPLHNPDPGNAIAAYVSGTQEIPNYSNGFNPPEYIMDIEDIGNGESGSSRLTIASTSVVDDRRYWCRVALDYSGDQAVDVNLTVVVSPSSIKMSQDGTEVSRIIVSEGIPSYIVCTSFASNPPIDIVWTVQKDDMDVDITSVASQINTINADLTSDSVSTLEYTFTKDYDGETLTCTTRGHHLAVPKADSSILNVQYEPDVTVTHEGNTVLCKSDANPAAFVHTIKVNRGTLEYRPYCEGTICSLSLEVDYDTDIMCNATNVVGTGSAGIVEVPGIPQQPTSAQPTIKGSPTGTSPQQTTTIPTNEMTKAVSGDELGINITAIVLGILLCVSIVIIAFLLYQVLQLLRYKNSMTKENKTQSCFPNVPQTYMELDQQTRQCNSTYEEPTKKSDTAQTYEDLDPHTREEKTAYQSMIPKDESPQGIDNVAYEEIPATRKTQIM